MLKQIEVVNYLRFGGDMKSELLTKEECDIAGLLSAIGKKYLKLQKYNESDQSDFLAASSVVSQCSAISFQ